MKKRIFLVVTSILLAVAYIALGLFAYAQDAEEKPADVLPLDGAWRVVSYTKDNNVTLIPQEFMVFTDGKAADYRDSLDQPFVESPYTYEDGTLSLESLGRSYVVDRKGEHVLHLYTSPAEYMELAYYGSMENAALAFTPENLQGSWKIAYRRGLEQIGEESLSFDGAALSDFRNGSAEPAVTAPYEWDADGHLVVSRLAKVYILYPISMDEIYFVETDTGYVWNLIRVK